MQPRPRAETDRPCVPRVLDCIRNSRWLKDSARITATFVQINYLNAHEPLSKRGQSPAVSSLREPPCATSTTSISFCTSPAAAASPQPRNNWACPNPPSAKASAASNRRSASASLTAAPAALPSPPRGNGCSRPAPRPSPPSKRGWTVCAKTAAKTATATRCHPAHPRGNHGG